uniref:Uncharacterized protein n=1 Tax=Rhizophora mucronata TaxID=61149 RepID=A0A2P2QW89_RHIMU
MIRILLFCMLFSKLLIFIIMYALCYLYFLHKFNTYCFGYLV